MKSKNPSNKRSFSTMARRSYTLSTFRRQELTQGAPDSASYEAVLASIRAGEVSTDSSKWLEERGYQFQPVWRNQNWKQGVEETLPEGVTGLQKNITPDTDKMADVLPNGWKFKERYHPLVEQVVGLMIRDGKKAQAERVCIAQFNNCGGC